VFSRKATVEEATQLDIKRLSREVDFIGQVNLNQYQSGAAILSPLPLHRYGLPHGREKGPCLPSRYRGNTLLLQRTTLVVLVSGRWSTLPDSVLRSGLGLIRLPCLSQPHLPKPTGREIAGLVPWPSDLRRTQVDG